MDELKLIQRVAILEAALRAILRQTESDNPPKAIVLFCRTLTENALEAPKPTLKTLPGVEIRISEPPPSSVPQHATDCIQHLFDDGDFRQDVCSCGVGVDFIDIDIEVEHERSG